MLLEVDSELLQTSQISTSKHKKPEKFKSVDSLPFQVEVSVQRLRRHPYSQTPDDVAVGALVHWWLLERMDAWTLLKLEG